MENKHFKHDGMTLKQIANSLPEIAENRTRLLIVARHVVNYAIKLEQKFLAENSSTQDESAEGEGKE